jgi:hypothetical protein
MSASGNLMGGTEAQAPTGHEVTKSVSGTSYHVRRLGPRASHKHSCGHGCFCYAPTTATCHRCRMQAVNAELARRRHEDSLSTEALLERRA